MTHIPLPLGFSMMVKASPVALLGSWHLLLCPTTFTRMPNTLSAVPIDRGCSVGFFGSKTKTRGTAWLGVVMNLTATGPGYLLVTVNTDPTPLPFPSTSSETFSDLQAPMHFERAQVPKQQGQLPQLENGGGQNPVPGILPRPGPRILSRWPSAPRLDPM